MITFYSVSGFVGAFVFLTVFYAIFRSGTSTGRVAFIKALLRRILVESLLVAVTLGVAVVVDSDRGFQALAGVAVYLGINWLWTGGVWGYLGLRWLFSNREDEPSVAVRSPLATWTKEIDNAEIEVRFDNMTMIVETSFPDWVDGSTMYDISKESEKGWSPARVEEGWTEHEWKNFYRHTEYEIRRTPEGHWQSRLAYKYWARESANLHAKLDPASRLVPSFYAPEQFEKLHGFTWEQWLNREKVPLPPGDERRWANMRDDLSPSIETAYQRYVHQG